MTEAVSLDRDCTWAFRRYQFLAFMMLGVVNPFLSRYLQSRGLNADQMGWVQSVQWLTAAAVPFLWGMLADSVHDRRMPLAGAILGAAGIFTTLYLGHSFLALLVLTVLFAIFFRGITPMGTGLIFAYAESRGRDYSRIRLFGTAGYVVSMLLMFVPLWVAGINAIFPCFLVFAAAALTGLWSLPRLAGTGRQRLDWGPLRLFGHRNFAVYLACAFVAQAAMATHYSFFTPYLHDLGVRDANIVLFWCFGSVIEALMMTQTGRLIQRFGTKAILALGILGIALRLSIYSAFPIIWVLFLAQSLHALSFAAVHTSTVTFVNYAAPTKWRTSAQTIFEGLSIGLASAVGSGLGGMLTKATNYRVLFASASAVAILALVAFAVLGRSVALTRTPAAAGLEAEAEE